MEKISTSNAFGQAKRCDIVDFLKQRGELSCAPAVGTYKPTNDDLNTRVNDKHDVKRLLARAQHNDELAKYTHKSVETAKSAQNLRKQFQRLSNAYTDPKTWSLHDRFGYQHVAHAPGPGQYESTSELASPTTTKSSTFGKAIRKDLLHSLEDAGFVSISDLGPGVYEGPSSMFEATTWNAKCGYKHAHSQKRVNRKTPITYQVPASSRVFGSNVSGRIGREELWKALMQRPNPENLGYTTSQHMPPVMSANPKYERHKVVAVPKATSRDKSQSQTQSLHNHCVPLKRNEP